MRRILITGSNGLLGQKIANILASETNYEVLLTSVERKNYLEYLKYDFSQLDITSKSDVKSLIHNFKPEIIINTAAYTDVDDCENEREFAWRLNVDSVKNLIITARFNDSKIIHFSSDYIFDGKKGPYSEDDNPNPMNYYGKTKLASENALRISGVKFTIIRTMIIYGLGRNVRQNFVLWVINQLQNNQVIHVVDDQFGNPTFVDDIAYATLKIIEGKRTGIYNIAGSECISRYKFAQLIAKIFSLNADLIKPAKTSDLGQIAHRPLKSGLNCFKAATEMGIRFLNPEEGLCVLKRQIDAEGYYNLKNQ